MHVTQQGPTTKEQEVSNYVQQRKGLADKPAASTALVFSSDEIDEANPFQTTWGVTVIRITQVKILTQKALDLHRGDDLRW